MKKTIKIVTGLIIALLVLLLTFVLLKGCGSSKVDKSGFYTKESQTSKTSTSSTKKSKSSSKKSSSSSTSTQADSSTEAASSTDSSTSNGTTQAQTTPSQSASATQDNTTTSESVPQAGYGYWEATSGTLELLKDTPVYAEPNKDSGVAYIQPQADIEWDKYLYENGEWWYSFVQKNRDQEVRFYIAYSDVGY